LGDSWDRRHKPALLRMSDKFEIRAVYDEVSYRGRAQATELECDVADGFTCLIERDDIDAVYVLGGGWHGLEPVRAACRARKAIFLGRPIGSYTPCTDELIRDLQLSGVQFMVEFPWRFFPASIRLMELLASGLGAPQLAICEQHVLESEKGAWSASRSEPNGDSIMLQIADWFRFLFSQDPTSTQSFCDGLMPGPCRGVDTLVVRFGDACVGQATVLRFHQSQWTEAAKAGRNASFRVIAERGMAFLNMPGEITWFDQSGRHEESLDMDRPLGELLNERFYRIVQHGLTPSPGLDDALWARRIVREAREAQDSSSSPQSLAHRTAG
jgi:predicted dehydrogenase